MSNVFHPHHARGISKCNNHQSFKESLVRVITSLSCYHQFQKASFPKCFPAIFKFLIKLSILDGLFWTVVWLNQRDGEAAVSNFSGSVDAALEML